jgi:hypothetical protein
MSFADFEHAIKSRQLLEFATHWNEARGDRLMPDWSDLKPPRIAQQLSIVWSYRYDRAGDRFVGRLAGDCIEKVFGKTFRSTPMNELYPPDCYPVMFRRFRSVVCEPALYLEEGKVFQLVDHYGLGERIAMPLSSDGMQGDGIVGATVYEVFRGASSQPREDKENWFSL